MRVHTKTAKERAQARRRGLMLALACLCAILGAVVLMNLDAPRGASPQTQIATTKQVGADAIPVSRPQPSAASPSSTIPLSAGAVTISATDVQALTVKKLLIPVAGVAPGQLHDSFHDSRSEGRIHQALDIMAPRDTPVLATDDGKVMKLHRSDRGGIMLYQSDPSGIYVYYYGHLTRYADDVFEGKEVKRGEVIAYVGDTGNAGAGNYHLHFGISKASAPGRWSGGEPINPFPLLVENPSSASIGAGR